MKQRIDTLMAERGLARSRSAAAQSVRAGRVQVGVDGPRAMRPSDKVDVDADLIVVEPQLFVSRGGEKLAPVLDALGVDPAGRRCLDVGASTGGFTDCLLQRGADTVVALDVGHGQLDFKLRKDDRVVVIERFNARDLAPADLPWLASLITVDVSFIGITKLIAPLASCLESSGEILAMVKPQFELDASRVGKGGVVRDASDRRDAVRLVLEAAERCGLYPRGLAAAGVDGPMGNREVFVQFGFGESPGFDLEGALTAEVA